MSEIEILEYRYAGSFFLNAFECRKKIEKFRARNRRRERQENKNKLTFSINYGTSGLRCHFTKSNDALILDDLQIDREEAIKKNSIKNRLRAPQPLE